MKGWVGLKGGHGVLITNQYRFDAAANQMKGACARFFPGAPSWPLDPVFSGARVQDVRQTDPLSIVLEVHRSGRSESGGGGAGETSWWFWSVNDQSARSGRVFARPRVKGTQAVFRRWLHTRLVGSRVEGAWRPDPGLLVVEFCKGDVVHILVFELNRGGSNLLLLDGEAKLLAALAHPSRAGRKLAPGLPYTPPARFRGFDKSIPFEERLPAPDEATAQARARDWTTRDTLSQLDTRRRSGLQLARREVKKRLRRLEKLEGDKAEGAQADLWRRRGELLQIHRGRLEAGRDAVEVADVFEPGEPMVTIPLDPRADPGENIERCFKRARKLRDGASHVTRRMAETRAEAARWEDLARAIGDAADLGALEDLAATLGSREKELRKRLLGETKAPRETGGGSGILRRYSQEGYLILAGRSDRDNDEVTFRLGRGRDWWFHAQGMTGSHVIVSNPKDGPLPLRTLQEAAWLAAYYSRGRASGRVEVDYTQRKHVRKIKGGAPGQVLYSQNKTALVDLEHSLASAVLERTEPELV